MRKEEKGITLIALVVTIVVLLILAGVTISMLTGENGIITRVQEAKEKTEQATLDEQKKLSQIEASTNLENQEYIDSDGNIAVVPAGFAVSSIEKEQHINMGLVIIDTEGNEYVWIPVTKDENGNPTKPYESTGGKLNSVNNIEIQLGRYSFDPVTGEPTALSGTGGYTEDTLQNHNNNYKNKIALNITEFKESVKENGGYYIGRYEAGITGYDVNNIVTSNSEEKTNWTGYNAKIGENLKLVCKPNAQIWNYVTQNKASDLCQNLYTRVNSDLMNSYAWDTAILFIQECGTEVNSNTYSIQIGKSTTSSTVSKTGEAILLLGDGAGKIDKQCNIYDMAGNAWEWSTETGWVIDYPCVYRGGGYSYDANYTSSKWHSNTVAAFSAYTFRPILYL